ncbi:hypothetical protein [Janthinobacterium psychrotolerans]|uniref:Uncharacterized protein n=1 Tax=Janthinobacterium psychrotolerans TaxID=1747903 RepID=A0A1A7BXE5_9BURK|nr:hypothetical protein [Janthinobacterium psychrotolerans]OBV38276.1 hypothetical protein ASR47_1005230 [Janthinobacterium psychrotolerans]
MKPSFTPGMKKPAATRALPTWLGELHLVRRALLCCAATLLLSLLALQLASDYRDRQAQRLDLAQKERRAAAARFNQVETEKLEIRAFAPRFRALQRRGLIGEENRLAWIDAIRLIQQQRHLLPLSYEINAQQVLKVPLPLTMGQYQLRGSKMQLHMDLLHEMDLLNFFDDLRQSGYFAVQDCALKRGGAAASAGQTASLSADCTLLWLTLGNRPLAVQGQP